uniref:Uncharacterized protein n=1 Tax=Wuchereria bancrofti TaxID=6293 RepID=A0A1I8EN71_WUCBA
IAQCAGFLLLAIYTLYYTITYKKQTFNRKFDQVLMSVSIFLGIIISTWSWIVAAKCYKYLKQQNCNFNETAKERCLWRTDDKIFTLLAFPSLFISFNLIILSSYLFAVTMTEVRSALLNTEDIMLQVMDSVLVCLVPTNIMNRICASDAKNIRYKKNI